MANIDNARFERLLGPSLQMHVAVEPSLSNVLSFNKRAGVEPTSFAPVENYEYQLG